MRNDPKVVTLKRNAAYLHHRAMQNRRDNRIVDALELMRRAVEASPENREYRMDLAELYCEMGCHEQSSELLLDILSREDAPSECYYGLALNQLGMNDMSGARQSLSTYWRRDPQGEHSAEVRQLATELDFYGSMARPDDRRLYRAMRIANRACDAMRADDHAKACRLFRQALTMAPGQPEIRALFAMALGSEGRSEAARREAEQACAGRHPTVRTLCICAQVFSRLGDETRAIATLDAAEAKHPEGLAMRLLLYTASELKLYGRAAEYARLALQAEPYDRELLHARAVALKQAGGDNETSARCWERVLRIDPDDTVATYYCQAARDGTLDGLPLDYTYQVPEYEYLHRAASLVTHFEQGFEHISECWATDPAFRRTLRWAVFTGDQRLSRAAMTVLATLEDENALGVLRTALFDPGVSRALKLHAVFLLKLQGREMSDVLPEPVAAGGNMLVDTEALLNSMPVGDRQLIRYADEVLEREYGISARPALTLMWSAYRRSRGTRGDPLKRVDAAAAALACNYLMTAGERRPLAELAKAFGCSNRQLVFCASRIAGSMDRAEATGTERLER
ncbi:MAG: tetratricopeptide repeat protein [Clostridia bacterium]|nr:tetratricopeptide repeat protein [Clostridia bacterium]